MGGVQEPDQRIHPTATKVCMTEGVIMHFKREVE